MLEDNHPFILINFVRRKKKKTQKQTTACLLLHSNRTKKAKAPALPHPNLPNLLAMQLDRPDQHHQSSPKRRP